MHFAAGTLKRIRPLQRCWNWAQAFEILGIREIGDSERDLRIKSCRHFKNFLNAE